MVGQLTKLVAGRVPAHTVCPFRSQCAFVANSTCHHKGEQHAVAFSCGAARAYDLIQRNTQDVDSIRS
jgi:hypothetical protein